LFAQSSSPLDLAQATYNIAHRAEGIKQVAFACTLSRQSMHRNWAFRKPKLAKNNFSNKILSPSSKNQQLN